MNVSTTTAATGVAATAAPAHRGHRISDATMGAVATKLGMSSDDLKTALASGQSMTDLAETAGVSRDDLVSTIASTLPSQAGAASTQLAGRIADHARPAGAPGARPPHGGSGDGSTVGQGIDALSGALGISSDDLLQRLTDGTGIADLLSGNSGVASQLTASQNKGALVDGWA